MLISKTQEEKECYWTKLNCLQNEHGVRIQRDQLIVQSTVKYSQKAYTTKCTNSIQIVIRKFCLTKFVGRAKILAVC